MNRVSTGRWLLYIYIIGDVSKFNSPYRLLYEYFDTPSIIYYYMPDICNRAVETSIYRVSLEKQKVRLPKTVDKRTLRWDVIPFLSYI